MAFRYDDQIKTFTGQWPQQPKTFPHHSANTITRHGIAQFAAGCNPKTRYTDFVLMKKKQKISGDNFQSGLLNPHEGSMVKESATSGQAELFHRYINYLCPKVTVRRLRPLARRRRRTSCPLAVAMRARNPWVRSLLRLCG